MQYEGNTVRDLTIAYIGGGSRGWAWGFMADLAMDPQLSGTVRLYDIDKDAAGKNAVIGNKMTAHPDAAAAWQYVVSDSLQTALTGADFIVISILPATFEEMRADVHMPERLGVYQSVGDTVGPGGFMRAMRTLPMYVEIAEAIRDFAPEAWVINYTNPMSLCMRCLYTVFPQVRAFGCCHEVFSTQKLLAAMLADMKGIEDVKREEIKINVQGINHFTWLSEASYQGIDLFPLYEEFSWKYFATGFTKENDDNWMNNFFATSHRVKFDLFHKYGLMAAAGDRHLAEFMPPWYLKDPGTAKSWGFSLTPVDWRVENLAERIAKRERLISGEEDVALEATGEEGHLLIKALLGLGDLVSNVNVPNAGQIPNVPQDAIVETNALFRRGSIRPIMAGPLPGNVEALVIRHVANQENTLKVALTCDRKLGVTTFLNDPLMSRVDFDDGAKLFDDMLTAQKAYLPTEWFA